MKSKVFHAGSFALSHHVRKGEFFYEKPVKTFRPVLKGESR